MYILDMDKKGYNLSQKYDYYDNINVNHVFLPSRHHQMDLIHDMTVHVE